MTMSQPSTLRLSTADFPERDRLARVSQASGRALEDAFNDRLDGRSTLSRSENSSSSPQGLELPLDRPQGRAQQERRRSDRAAGAPTAIEQMITLRVAPMAKRLFSGLFILLMPCAALAQGDDASAYYNRGNAYSTGVTTTARLPSTPRPSGSIPNTSSPITTVVTPTRQARP